ncbi:hypothetical protein EIKCOROL_01233 [Eikenella corrodens ATCC 23834]|uniref:Uncharacterized protein n=1 Tax=Eikenella corrodens ATCC 23834 TaxID=546274 RepID=C0DV44_EIKCO|nr:hypothetical protein EIKCOROL_01233 [Eikenella corrodens ATCC 23834]
MKRLPENPIRYFQVAFFSSRNICDITKPITVAAWASSDLFCATGYLKT